MTSQRYEVSNPARCLVAVDYGLGDVTLDSIARGFHANTSGNIVLTFQDDTTATIAVIAGAYYPYAFKGVVQSGSTATIFAIY